MAYIEGEDRNQIVMFPECMDDYVAEDNIVRFIDKYVNSLDMEKLGFKRATANNLGAPSYNPRDLLKLYLYGYLNKLRSSRTLERETHRNIELIWLMNKLKPDFKTIADFRKDNTQAIKNLFKEFLGLSKKLGLLSNKFVAIDGSHFKAVNAQDKHLTKNKLAKKLKNIEKTIDEYMDLLDKVDKQEDHTKDGPSTKELLKQLEDLQRSHNKTSKLIEDVTKTGKDQMCFTDPDSCVMRQGVGYNVQIAVDSENSMIVAFDTTDAPVDNNQLSNMAKQAKEALEVDELEVVADTGYYNYSEIKECSDNQITPYVPEPLKTTNPMNDEMFSKTNFTYDRKNDCYICPCKSKLELREIRLDKKGRKYRVYNCNNAIDCPLKSKCTNSKYGRYICHWEDEDIIDDMRKRLIEEKDKVKKRKAIVEHPFGTIKRAMNQSYFLMKGKAKVSAEFALTSIAYNIQRAKNVLGMAKLIEAIG